MRYNSGGEIGVPITNDELKQLFQYFLYSIPSLHNVQLEYQLGTRVAITPGSKFDVKKRLCERELRGRLAQYFSLHNST